ncbi:WhiB family transcriptional regulator [Actinoallomurus sp. CA-150999]|uniref:WhiB family transcriptional regulator n=1 Tax=Actinoallomurus sp. CA-150999 TaxID=3239887 RepID=UPI003D90EFCE
MPELPAGRIRADWRDHAACRGMDTELFFPIGSSGPALAQIGQAKRVCAGCPVRIPCLGSALAGGDVGVWGGTTEDERRALRHTRRAVAGLDAVVGLTSLSAR